MTKTSATTVLFDEQCGFCIWTVHLLLRLDRGHRLSAEPIQRRRDLLPGLDDDRALDSFHLVDAEGAVHSAGAGLVEVLRAVPLTLGVGRVLGRLPRVAEAGYRLVADHRGQLARVVPEGAKARAREQVLGHETPPGPASRPAAG